jgi:hypothetical protein
MQLTNEAQHFRHVRACDIRIKKTASVTRRLKSVSEVHTNRGLAHATFAAQHDYSVPDLANVL